MKTTKAAWLAMALAAAPLAAAKHHDYADAEVRKVDRDAAKVTLKHGPIESLDMPAMTMVFRVRDAAMLETLQPGEKVRFRAEKVGGQYTIMEIRVPGK